MNYKSKTRKRGNVTKLVKGRKYSNLRKHSKKRRGTYKHRNKTQHLRKKRISITRKRNGRKMYGGEGECNNEVEKAIEVQRAIAAIASFPKGFKTFFDILEKCPDVIQDGHVQREYTQKIELKDGTRKIGYIGLLGLQLINYLNTRITKLRIQRDELEKYLKNYEHSIQEIMKVEKYQELEKIKTKIDSLKTAISLMDQVAAAPGVVEGQLQTVRSNVDKKYYDCYVKLYNELTEKFNIGKKITQKPLSTSLCYFSETCDSDTDSEVCDTCCIPNNLDFAIKRQNNTTPTDQHEKRQKLSSLTDL